MSRRGLLLPLLAVPLGCAVSRPDPEPVSPLGPEQDGTAAILARPVPRWCVVVNEATDRLWVWGTWPSAAAASRWANSVDWYGSTWRVAGITEPGVR